MKSVTIHSDGACEGNPGPGGWAAVLDYNGHVGQISGGEIATTNNRMEIRAAIEALRKLKEPCEVQFFTDSEYLKNGITIWIKAWKRKNWKKGQKPIKNADLWQQLDEAASLHKVTWHWVRGHSGDAKNETCDRLAVAEISKIRKRHTRTEISAAVKQFVEERAQTPSVDEKAAALALSI